jgi:hypothetical protein
VARRRARDVHRCICDNDGGEHPPVFTRASQNVAAATILLRTMPEASTLEGRQAHGELRVLLKCVAVQQAESSASRGMGPSPTSPHRQQYARRKLQSTENSRKQEISPRLSTPSLTTTTTRATSSTRAKGTRRMVLAAVTTLDGAAATTAGRTGAHRPNPRDRRSSAKTSVTRRS